ncbi:MAG: peptidoglycan DD-metalloendopeptidase family protein [Dysgonamonadaceae bacterium]|jgi:septal ring factor EnvC (AmiA/AmiB activator)|nr:peptidoglycan DD-metalloendopeptidase family protein [Dysgonamonadaceae bacterium]
MINKSILCIILLSVTIISLNASENIQNLRKQRETILKDILATQQLIDAKTTNISNALDKLNLIDNKITAHKKIIQLLNSEINIIDSTINAKEYEIKDLEKDLNKRREHYTAAIRKIYTNKNALKDNIMFILAADNFTQSFHRITYLKDYQTWCRKQGEEIAGKQKHVQKEKNLLIDARSEKQYLLKGKQDQEENLIREEHVKQKEIKSLEKDKKQLAEELEKKRKKANALNSQIEKYIVEETSNSARNKSTENRKEETKGGYAMTPTEKKLSVNFEANKGKLPMPLKGKYRITAYFGVHRHQELSHLPVNNNGIEIETTAGTEVRSVFEGIVSRIFIVPGFSTNNILIRHGNYISLYANLEKVYVKQGDRVKTGQSIGKIFTDRDNASISTLHFELRKETAKLDPLQWLDR